MNRFYSILLTIIFVLPINARNFTYEYEGQKVVYSVIDEEAKTCETVNLTSGYGNPYHQIKGKLIIPRTVSDGTNKYVVTRVGTGSFQYNNELDSVFIPNSVNSIGYLSFAHCNHLKYVNLPTSLKDISKSAFYLCSRLETITIPNSVTSIGDFAFSYCVSLQNFFIPASISELGKGVFSQCSNITNYTVDNENKHYSSTEGILFNKEKSTLVAYPSYRSSSYTIPASVNSIGDYAFSESSISYIFIPPTIKSIGKYAFEYSNIKNINFSNSITTIEEGTFSYCKFLKSIIIPNSVKSIDSMAFYYCQDLMNVTISDSVSKIGSSAFAGDFRIDTIKLPALLAELGSGAFNGCNWIKEIFYPSDNPVESLPNVFHEQTYKSAKLFVPKGSLNKFFLTEPWSLFENIEEYEFSGIENTIMNFDLNIPINVYNLNGIHVSDNLENLSKGLYIIRQGKNAKKLLIK